MLSIRSALLLFEFMKTNRRALKKIQYNIAANVAMTITIILLNIHSDTATNMAQRIHRKIPTNIPSIPSPKSL